MPGEQWHIWLTGGQQRAALGSTVGTSVRKERLLPCQLETIFQLSTIEVITLYISKIKNKSWVTGGHL